MVRVFILPIHTLRKSRLLSTCVNYKEKITLNEQISRIAKKGATKPSEIYQTLVEKQAISDDSFQREICVQLDTLNYELRGFTLLASTIGVKNSSIFNIFKTFASSSSVDQPPSVYGLYIHGNVGTGKTMLMDMFYTTSPVNKKQRIHFNRFMLNIHKRIADIKRLQTGISGSQIWDMIAGDLVENVHLLCFDEFQVTDIADAMIMKLLFEALFRRGVVVIATSNREPDKLYENGLQRQNFVPFIPILKSRVKTLNLDTGLDYRRSETFDFNYPSWLEKSDQERIAYHVSRLYSEYGAENTSSTHLIVLGHKLNVPKSSGRVAEFTFRELCEEGLGEPLGAQDYIALADAYDVLIINEVPRLDLFLMNSMIRRFITMVDNLYDNHVGLLLILDDKLDNLYYDSDTHDRELTQAERLFMDDHSIQGVSEGVKVATLSGSEEAFAIERKISRLSEMSSEKYWAQVSEKFSARKNVL